ncbi:flagellar biosynthesis protein FliQ [Candidatus Jidaibacter acanthamoebae]|nr:flagellar biosynthesis protein FliQ [Candidatus Jidaibacter acanthamoeba]
MEPNLIIDIAKEAIWVYFKLALPLLLISLFIGLVISLFQALTQIQEATLSFVPKVIVVFLSLIFLFPFIGSSLSDFSDHLFSFMINLD